MNCPKCGKGSLSNVRTSTGHYDICKLHSCDYTRFYPDSPAVPRLWNDSVNSIPTYTTNGVHYTSHKRECDHWRQKVQVVSYTVTCSASMDKGKLDPYPDLGIYMAESWKYMLGRIWTTGIYVQDMPRLYPAMWVDWPDQGVVPIPTLEAAVNVARARLRHSEWVDIGCMGGHGRTGTFLACLLVRMEHLGAKQAIDEVHKRYCHKAIETESQEKLIGEYMKRVDKLI